MLTCSYDGTEAYCSALFQYLKELWQDKLGIVVSLEPLDKSVMTELCHKGKLKITPRSWDADYMDADNMLSKSVTGGGINAGRYSGEVFDKAYYPSLIL